MRPERSCRLHRHQLGPFLSAPYRTGSWAFFISLFHMRLNHTGGCPSVEATIRPHTCLLSPWDPLKYFWACFLMGYTDPSGTRPGICVGSFLDEEGRIRRTARMSALGQQGSHLCLLMVTSSVD
ncbi:uncharacterized protein LOC143672943 [Tamandua tetradactyla]|uniref:uncharacterized protein LOC143672943 n=1 Tax=Tamandua tetradactyla TaxID=48850 RepID=UPI0040549CEB